MNRHRSICDFFFVWMLLKKKARLIISMFYHGHIQWISVDEAILSILICRVSKTLFVIMTIRPYLYSDQFFNLKFTRTRLFQRRCCFSALAQVVLFLSCPCWYNKMTLPLLAVVMLLTAPLGSVRPQASNTKQSIFPAFVWRSHSQQEEEKTEVVFITKLKS